MNLNDLWLNAPLLSIVLTSLLLVVVVARKSAISVSYGISLFGIAVAAFFAITGLSEQHTTFNEMVQTGGFAGFVTALLLSIAFVTIILSKSYLERTGDHLGEFYILILFATTGMILLASASDLIITFLGIETMSLALYVLAGFRRTKEKSNESALKYFLLGAFATGFLLYGIALVYGTAGTTNLILIGRLFPSLVENGLFVIGAGLLVVALSFKVAAVPFHMWAPDVYEGAPTTVTAFMSTGTKVAAFAAFVSIFLRTFDFGGARLGEVIALIAAASMIVGNITAIAQNNLKRMLAYSSVAHAGYMLSGVAAGNQESETGILFYLVAYSFMNLGAFGVISWMEKENDRNLTFDDYAGLSAERPVIAALMAIFMFSLAGIPPFAGFFGKYYVFLAAVKANMTWLAVIGVLTSLVSVSYYLRLVMVMYFREGKPEVSAGAPVSVLLVISIAAILTIVLGIYPSVLVDLVMNY